MSNKITGFTFEGVSIDFVNAEQGVVGIYQGDDAVETTPKNMTEICIQWLALHDPDVLRGGD